MKEIFRCIKPYRSILLRASNHGLTATLFDTLLWIVLDGMLSCASVFSQVLRLTATVHPQRYDKGNSCPGRVMEKYGWVLPTGRTPHRRHEVRRDSGSCPWAHGQPLQQSDDLSHDYTWLLDTTTIGLSQRHVNMRY